MSDLYQELILEELQNLQHLGQLSGEGVCHHLGHNASCGDQVEVFVEVSAAENNITSLKWQGSGCAISMATMSLLAAKVNTEQLSVSNLMSLSEQDMLELLGLETIVPGRVKCLTLGLRSTQAALVASQLAGDNVYTK